MYVDLDWQPPRREEGSSPKKNYPAGASLVRMSQVPEEVNFAIGIGRSLPALEKDVQTL